MTTLRCQAMTKLSKFVPSRLTTADRINKNTSQEMPSAFVLSRVLHSDAFTTSLMGTAPSAFTLKMRKHKYKLCKVAAEAQFDTFLEHGATPNMALRVQWENKRCRLRPLDHHEGVVVGAKVGSCHLSPLAVLLHQRCWPHGPRITVSTALVWTIDQHILCKPEDEQRNPFPVGAITYTSKHLLQLPCVDGFGNDELNCGKLGSGAAYRLP